MQIYELKELFSNCLKCCMLYSNDTFETKALYIGSISEIPEEYNNYFFSLWDSTFENQAKGIDFEICVKLF